MAHLAKLRSKLPFHCNRLDQPSIFDAVRHGGELAAIVVQFCSSFFYVAATPCYCLDGKKPVGTSASRLLCSGLLPGKCNIYLFDLGAYWRTRHVTARAQDHANTINCDIVYFRYSFDCGAEIADGWIGNVYLLLNRLSQAFPIMVVGAYNHYHWAGYIDGLTMQCTGTPKAPRYLRITLSSILS